ncbi:MAG: hypothetical protein K5798_06880 [Nitrosopumilus sp.]|uniref:Uncharacterized protein n=1 Tax=Nitrosopumilus zosterae TaxID=718286 RepID=A0A2S2KSN9_9ARCH|nr:MULTISPECIES: hypothetical protein [Nitrosopumilus]MCV0366967.1 hypothetical protein [Nitrosopumilus sp.]BDQ30911.1 hypothetical protein NZOSNM25_001019 [Nitrosopumilus zosterae]GBH34475.1 hypothetical protein NZNM25_12660 [Nitrosopumilus zosterae]
MTENNDLSEHDLFVTEFPKKDFGIVDYLQGRVHFALLDQMKFMSASGMTKTQIKEVILTNVTEIIDKLEEKESESF